MIVTNETIDALAQSIYIRHRDIVASDSFLLEEFFLAKSVIRESTSYILFKGATRLGVIPDVTNKDRVIQSLNIIFARAIESTIDETIDNILKGYPSQELIKAHGNIVLARSSYPAPGIYRKDVITLDGKVVYSEPRVGDEIDHIALETVLKELIYSEVMSGKIDIHV